MKAKRAGGPVGCLCIGEITPGASWISGRSLFTEIPGVETRPFRPSRGDDLWGGLQTALQEARGDWGAASVLALGTGCAAALALAEQLPVERLVLIDPELSPKSMGSGVAAQAARRLAAYARRNLSLCVSDALVVERGRGNALRALCGGGLSAHSRAIGLRVGGEIGNKMYTIRENAVKQAISCFLHAGELPKPLAENSEMCIIYG